MLSAKLFDFQLSVFLESDQLVSGKYLMRVEQTGEPRCIGVEIADGAWGAIVYDGTTVHTVPFVAFILQFQAAWTIKLFKVHRTREEVNATGVGPEDFKPLLGTPVLPTYAVSVPTTTLGRWFCWTLAQTLR